MVSLLCAEGGDPDIQSTNGGTPLHNAASSGHLEAAEALLAANADVDVQNSNGNTPMHVAAAKGVWTWTRPASAHPKGSTCALRQQRDLASAQAGGTPHLPHHSRP